MRRRAWITAIALCFGIAVSLWARLFIADTVEYARGLNAEAIECMDRGDEAAAEEVLTQLAQYLKDRQGLMRILCAHEDIDDIKEELIDAQASIEFGSSEDFYQASYRFGERLEQLSDAESLSLSNFC